VLPSIGGKVRLESVAAEVAGGIDFLAREGWVLVSAHALPRCDSLGKPFHLYKP
jgi:hypothetical protein